MIPTVTLILGVVVLTGWLALFNGEQAVNQLIGRYKQEIAAHVDQELRHCLEIPHQINQANAELVSLELLNLDNPAMLSQYLWRQLQQFPAVTNIYAGSETGGIVGVGRGEGDELRGFETEGFIRGEYRLYRTDADGNRQERIDSGEEFDARQRPWYEVSVRTGREAWSDVYLFVGEPILGISASRPVFNQVGQRVGVMATDLILTQIGEFLQDLEISPNSLLFIMERSGNLVATSAEEPPFMTSALNNEQQRLSAGSSEDPLTHAAYAQLLNYFRRLERITESKDLVLTLDGHRNLMRVVPFTEERGLDWLIVMVLPETDFMAQIYRNTRCAIALCFLAVILSIVLSIAIAHRLSRPLRQLGKASQLLAQGEFSRPLPFNRVRELNTLSNSFNAMAQRIQDSFDQLAQRNKDLEERVEERTAHLTQANYQLQLLLRSVSHDLRNPIMGMLMVFDHIRNQAGAESGQPHQPNVTLPRHVLEALVSSSERQLRLVNSLLDDHRVIMVKTTGDAGQPDAKAVESWGNYSLNLQPLLLGQIISQVMQDIQPLLVQHRTVLKRTPIDSLPPVLADADQLWRVIENLISNAVTHNPFGTQITIRAERVTSSRGGPMVCCKITDDGAGISFQKQTNLFAPDYQGDENSPGFGLGLYVCRRIIEAHNGVIGVFSQSGKGATFWFTLPIASDS
ncbi:MAG: ATP-binding protein [Elainellaceae cyanobacterium]